MRNMPPSSVLAGNWFRVDDSALTSRPSIGEPSTSSTLPVSAPVGVSFNLPASFLSPEAIAIGLRAISSGYSVLQKCMGKEVAWPN